MLLLRSDRESDYVEAMPVKTDIPTDLEGVAMLIPLPHRRRCALVAREGVTVNGIPAFPLHVLRDRDEIRAAGQTFYFTTDAVAEVSIVRTATPIRCARCLDALADGENVVRCPGCQTHHHPDCWNGIGCLKCLHPADGLSWIPERVW
jgi:RING finger family protein